MTHPLFKWFSWGRKSDRKAIIWTVRVGRQEAVVKIMSFEGFRVTFRTEITLPIKSAATLEYRLPPGPAQVGKIRILATREISDNMHQYTANLMGNPQEILNILNDEYGTGRPGSQDLTGTTDNRRLAPRLKKTFRVMSPDIAGFRALSRDIKATGVRLSLDGSLAIGRVISMTLDLDDVPYVRITCNGQVMWCRPGEQNDFLVGIRFLNLTPEDQMNLDHFISSVATLRQDLRQSVYYHKSGGELPQPDEGTAGEPPP